MATKDKILSNYPSVTDAAEGSLLYLVIPNVSSATGYTAKKITATDLAKSILNDYTFTNLLDTTAKNVFGAINELASGTYDVSDLGDVELTSLTGGQILMYDSESSKWVNYSLDTSVSADEVSYNNSASGLQATDLQNAVDEVASSLGSTSLAGLNDVNITSATADQVLKYDATNSKWVNGAASGGSSTLSDLTDTTITTPSNGQVLTYDSTSSKWINANASSGGGYTAVTGTLTAGSTSITLSDAAITTSSLIIPIVDNAWGIVPTSMTTTTGSVTLTFPVQASNLNVGVAVF